MEAALIVFLRERFGQAEAARIQDRCRRVFRIDPDAFDPPAVPDRHQEYGDLLRLLLEHAGDTRETTRAIARWIAFSCMGENHLWEDLGLPNRPELTRLMQDCFPRLRALNCANMRWKKFFYRQLCERAEVFACRSPTCDQCSEYGVCFGPAPPHRDEAASGAGPGSQGVGGRMTAPA